MVIGTICCPVQKNKPRACRPSLAQEEPTGRGALADELLITDRSNCDVNRHQSRRRPNASRRTKARANGQGEPGNCGHDRSSNATRHRRNGGSDGGARHDLGSDRAAVPLRQRFGRALARRGGRPDRRRGLGCAPRGRPDVTLTLTLTLPPNARRRSIAILESQSDGRLPDLARQVLEVLATQIEQLATAVAAVERQLTDWRSGTNGTMLCLQARAGA